MAKNEILSNDLLEIVNSDIIDWENFNDSTIFITGATGLIGSLIVRTIQTRNKLYSSNIKLCLLVRSKEKGINLFGDDQNIKYIENSVEEFIPANIDIDYIIHAASPTKSKFFVERPVETINTAVFGTQKMLELARINSVKSMIYLSSMEMYGTMKSDNVKENDFGYIDVKNVRSCYPEGKRISELYSYCYSQEYGVPVKIARIAQTFGPGIDVINENRVYKFFADSILAKRNIVLKSTGSTIINYGYTTDVVKGLLCILQKGINGESYNLVGDKTGMTILDSAKWLAEEFGEGQVEVVIDIPKENAGFAPDNNMVLDNEKIRSLGWFPSHDLKDGYRRLLEYMKIEYMNVQKDDNCTSKVKKIV